jgi:hypothetical protein
LFPGTETTPVQHVASQRAARAEFVAALEGGVTPLPLDPDGVERIVRRYDFDPTHAGRLSPLTVEDYPLAWAITTRARGIAEVLPMLWLLAIGQAVAQQEAEVATEGGGR